MKVFVYGTLKPGESNYQRYCQGKVIETYPATTQGQLFSLPIGYPALTIGTGQVRGFVLTFSDPKILDDLDYLEDYQAHRPPSKNEYQRQHIEALSLDGQSLGSVWAYLMLPERVKALGGVLLPTGWWEPKRST